MPASCHYLYTPGGIGMNKTLVKLFTATTLAFTAVAATAPTGVLAAKKEQKPDVENIHVVFQGQELSLEGIRVVKDHLIVPVEDLIKANGGTMEIEEDIITASHGDLSYSMRIHPRFFQFDSKGMLYAVIPSKIYAGKSINSLKQFERALGVELVFNEEVNTLYIN
jgi:hypothetical protein